MEMINEILYMLDETTLNKIKKKCEMYLTYSIDNKQINNKHDIKTKQKEYAILLEQVCSVLVIKGFELSAKKVSENIQSTTTESKAACESKKESK